MNKEDDYFEQLKLRVGDRLQIEVPTPHHDLRYFTSLVGYVNNLSILLRNPVVNGLSLPMREGELLLVRGFSGLKTFSFETTIQRVCLAPFPYLHVSYPIPSGPFRFVTRCASRPAFPSGSRRGKTARLFRLSFPTLAPAAFRSIQLKSSEKFTMKLAFLFISQYNPTTMMRILKPRPSFRKSVFWSIP